MSLIKAWATPLPSAPHDPQHPGSKIYPYSYSEQTLQCFNREVVVFLPKDPQATKPFPVVVYGHGQSLGLDYYRETFIHLARKGVAVIFPTYDDGFFDQDWQRMGHDYIHITECAFSQFLQELDSQAIVFSGHSKGAYVAGMAAGIAGHFGRHACSIHPKATVLFEPAGLDPATIQAIDPQSSLTVIFSEADNIVSREISEDIYKNSPSKKSQFITVKSYLGTTPEVEAGHMWPITEPTLFFGGDYENPLHYYGSWKWLVAAALDLQNPKPFVSPYLYGPLALDKGIPGLTDSVIRNW